MYIERLSEGLDRLRCILNYRNNFHSIDCSRILVWSYSLSKYVHGSNTSRS